MSKIGNFTSRLMFFLSTALMACQLYASPASVQATVDRNKMGPEDTLTLSVTVTAEGAVNVEEPRVPGLAGFDLLNTWTSQSSQARIEHSSQGIQVRETKTKQFNYVLSPKRKGSLDIGAFQVNVDGEIYKTKSIKIQVNKKFASSSSSRQRRGSKGFDPFPDESFSEAEEMFNKLIQRHKGRGGVGNFKSKPGDPNEAFFIQAEIDKVEAYVGEQITVNWYIYTRGAIESIDRLKFPTLRNFWKEDIEVSPSLTFRQYVVNGVPYRRALLGSYALFPIKAGKATVDSYKVKCRVRLASQRFGGFGLGKAYSYTKSSRPLKIQVKALPTTGQLENFSGAVGQFQVSSQVNGQQFPVNQPFSVKIRFEGQGNAKLIDLPPIDWPAQLELYDVKKESQFFKTGKSYKEFEVFLIPRQEGEVTIPPIKVGVFNPELGRYEEKMTQTTLLSITPGRQNSVIASSSELKKPEESNKLSREQELPNMVTSLDGGSFFNRTQKMGAWAFLYVVILMLLFWHGRNQLGWGQKGKSLEEQVSHRMKMVWSKVDQGNFRSVGSEMTNLVYFTLGELSEQGGANLEFNKLLEKAPPSVRNELKKPLSDLMNSFEILGFAPESVVGDLREKKKMKTLAKKMEKLLLKAVRSKS